MITEWFSWETNSPEEYAARRSHLIGEFSLDDYSYENKNLEDWLIRFGAIILDTQKMDECRIKYLTPKEYSEVKQSILESLN